MTMSGGGMVDISSKDITTRTAVARGTIAIGKEAFATVRTGQCKKGDVLTTARIASVTAVKSTADIIPLCHPILIENIGVEFDLDEDAHSITSTVTVKSQGRTGVEMEALCGASVACLTIYDMLKYIGKDMTISEICLVQKTGGRSGDYKRKDQGNIGLP